jgi:hypothetical protein
MILNLLSMTIFVAGVSAQTVSVASKPFPESFLVAADV